MRDAMVSLLAWIYLVALLLFPWLAAWAAGSFYAGHSKRRLERRRALEATPTDFEARIKADQCHSKAGDAALLRALGVGLVALFFGYAVCDFIYHNAHSIIRAAVDIRRWYD